MFLRQIDELETFFKWLDRLNLIAYNVWNDRQRESYQNAHMVQMENLYREYISDMRQISNELSLMQKQIQEGVAEVQRLQQEISDLKQRPSIEGCSLIYAEGYDDPDPESYTKTTEYFAATFDELGDLDSLAWERTHEILQMTDVHVSNRL